ncbi:MAG: hypothetical protein JNK48_22120 [Bryobacterales bacterium]|nr:hypothetical protein [Bryobacterales bacterium]
MQRIVHKFSIVYLTRGEKTQVFRSLEEVPEGVRKELAETARKSQIETLIIANERGRAMLQQESLQQGKSHGQGLAMRPAMRWALIALLAGTVGLVVTAAWNYR